MLTKRFLSFSASLATKHRHLVNIAQFGDEEFGSLINRAEKLKAVRYENKSSEYHQKLQGKLVALLFTKRSTRTRVSTEGAASFFGAQPMFLGKDDIQLGVNESIYDTTKVLSSMTSCVFARVDKHQQILDLCEASSVPIINSLCDKHHPLQAIADILTIKETFKKTEGLKLTWIGDVNNVLNDLATAAVKSGISVSVSVPQGINFEQDVETYIREVAKKNGCTFDITSDPTEALNGADVIVTDTWISMGEESQKATKLKQFEGYQITQDLIKNSSANPSWKFMHCLPRHSEEVSDDVFYSENSLVFQEAENRLYAAMAIIEALVVDGGKLN